jgi:SAM-dependent methyltransferase
MKNPYSALMRICLILGQVRLAWSFRRLYCPVPKKALVLEVGSGGSPYFRANVLVDAYTQTRERHWAPFVTDRPSVLGFGENLPFKDKSFDFVIASHVLEHSANPKKFLEELQRVAKAGYIETPDAFMERINPYWDHRSEVTVRDGVLVIKKKSTWKIDNDLVDLYEARAKNIIAKKTIPKNPFEFHTRFYWENSISYSIVNDEVDSSWEPPTFSHTTSVSASFRSRLSRIILEITRKLCSQNKRNAKLEIESLLICPSCKSSSLSFNKSVITCNVCGVHYENNNDVPVLITQG